MSFVNQQYLIQPAALAGRLGQPNLRILDCTVFLHPPPPGDHSFRIESGRSSWEELHIPGSEFADLAVDLSDRTTKLRFMLPPPHQFAEAMSSYGISNDSEVVLYDRSMNMWAARVWWNLRCFGFKSASVLDGGWRRWTSEGFPTTSERTTVPPGNFIARPQPDLMASKEDVLSSISGGSACLVNALGADQHRGEVAPYGRPGHIPTSTNVPAIGIVDPDTHAYRSAGELRELFQEAGALDAEKVITYCGGGIAASSDAFVLALLGQERVAVYDASMSEWAADPSLPLHVGPAASE